MLSYRPVRLLRDALKQSASRSDISVDLRLWEQLVRLLPDAAFIAANAQGYFCYRQVRVYGMGIVNNEL